MRLSEGTRRNASVAAAKVIPGVYAGQSDYWLAVADAVIESVEGAVEQAIANDQVRQMRKDGRCPTCGAEDR